MKQNGGFECSAMVPTSFFARKYLSSLLPMAIAQIILSKTRRTAGLKKSLRCEWLLPIQFQKRETFAYACEVYSRILGAPKEKQRSACPIRRANSHRPTIKSTYKNCTVSWRKPSNSRMHGKQYSNDARYGLLVVHSCHLVLSWLQRQMTN